MRLLAIGLVLLCAAVLAQEPALPPGLAAPPSPEEPALPPGLDGGDDSGPALPPGLGDAEADAPALPPGLGDEAVVEGEAASESWYDRLPEGLHGFWETRIGPRLQNDPAQSKSVTLSETRLQLEYKRAIKDAMFEATGDVWLDYVTEKLEGDLRQLRLTFRLGNNVDVRVGRQVLTWGTGDLIFINDLFPKDWQSFLSGRDEEYLKAPSDTIRVGWYNDVANVEVAYTPQFEPDRYITGDRLSYWDPMTNDFAGSDNQINANPPSDWFTDDEIALRIYRNFGSYEVAIYGYWGFWKSPGGQSLIPPRATFPRLNVYGASLRGPLGPGIFNVEAGYYDSRDDRSGSNPFVNNSEFRFFVGYEKELAKELTGAIQYYLEYMMDYDEYRDSLIMGEPRDEARHLFTVRLTKLLMNQNLTLSLFAFLSPSDVDAYLRPKATYKINDHWTIEGGGNWFFGEEDYTFFGQLENNSNIYASLRFSF